MLAFMFDVMKPEEKNVCILQSTFSKAFPWMEIFEFNQFESKSHECLLASDGFPSQKG